MSEREPAVVVKDLYKSFHLPKEQSSGLKQSILNIFRRPSKRVRGYDAQRVLQDISFEIKKGEFFGIVGKNGSGKSTLLKLLAGIYAPDRGLVRVEGTLTPFIELGVGFNPELTGRENVYLNGALLGFSHEEMDEMYEGIVEFAELDKFMDQKLKNYSSGMQVRLAFSIAVRAKSDILLIDEVLAVGDAAFQAKCFDYFYELKKSDTTVIFISHDRGALERFCTRGILIDNGKVIESGEIDKVVKRYNDVVLNQMEKNSDTSKQSSAERKVTVDHVLLFSGGKQIKNADFNDELRVQVGLTFHDAVTNPIIGLTLWKQGLEKNAIYAANNITESIGELGMIKAGEKRMFEITLPRFINDGEYNIEVGIANDSATNFYLQEKNALQFKVFGSSNPHAIMATNGKMKVATHGKS